ncbi:replication-relaxation family protein [Oscillochloris sp. ZM17-4]|uniref:replication-relaxation family protein n=1 Tax=Oscillochloris sp. ZM17-4 TaxID=2866714 RepID=UPI001C72F29F|nr:replication-relaxation family protein [Oscillochloris sp. ZM17-4]MBX0331078.1 replication-relaxation family protein [Oscillochloris sp. ZM17-4]
MSNSDKKKADKKKADKKKAPKRRPGRKLDVNAVNAWVSRISRMHPDVAAVVAKLPPRIYECERSQNPGYDGLGFPIPNANPVTDERMVELLRVLGRLYVADVGTLHRMLYYRRFGVRTTYNDLQHLAAQGFVWKVPAFLGGAKQLLRNRPVKPIHVYGLSRAGHQLLADMGVETDDRQLELLVKRDVTGVAAKPSSLAHDLQISWWCASMIEGLRLIPWCSGVWCQVEYNTITGQRADAILIARFDFRHPRAEQNQIPWFSGTPLREGEVELRWALELDNSTESVDILVKKFITYRDLHRNGIYRNVLGGDVMLVLVVQNQNRAAYLAAEFQRAWPDGWGVVSTPELANTTPFGAVWGTYLSMISEQPVPLLSRITQTLRPGENMIDTGFVTELNYLQWRTYTRLLLEERPPQSRGALQRIMAELKQKKV